MPDPLYFYQLNYIFYCVNDSIVGNSNPVSFASL